MTIQNPFKFIDSLEELLERDSLEPMLFMTKSILKGIQVK